jgi:hypothetical protein
MPYRLVHEIGEHISEHGDGADGDRAVASPGAAFHLRGPWFGTAIPPHLRRAILVAEVRIVEVTREIHHGDTENTENDCCARSAPFSSSP